MIFYLWMIISLFTFILKLNSTCGDCLTEKDCVFHSWLPWQDCSGQCGNQTQIRQRELRCPAHVVVKNEVNCLAACSLPVNNDTQLTEIRPCRVCDKGSLLVGRNTCVCNHGYRGPCCSSRSFLSLL